MNERIDPIVITDVDSGERYELDFNRESVMFMERQGFVVGENTFDFPVTNTGLLFYYAFRMNHRKIAKNQTDALLKKMGGVTPKIVERLIALYNQAAYANVVQDDEDLEKNPHVTVEF